MGKAEAKVEQYLVQEVEKIGGLAYKFTSPARRNVPDRLCVFPVGLVAFVECKAPGGVVSKGQAKELDRLANLSQPVFIVESREEVDEVIIMIISLLMRRRQQAKDISVALAKVKKEEV
jgi:hypothetical protein